MQSSLVQVPCRSGSPHGVLAGVHPVDVALAAAGLVCADADMTPSMNTTAISEIILTVRWLMIASLTVGAVYDRARLQFFLRKCPYSSSSAYSTHLNSFSCTFFSFRRYNGKLIFQGRV